MKSLYGKRQKPMPAYTRSEEEFEWYEYCVKNNIRISPYGIQNDPDHWHIAISVGPYKKWEKPHLSLYANDLHHFVCHMVKFLYCF